MSDDLDINSLPKEVKDELHESMNKEMSSISEGLRKWREHILSTQKKNKTKPNKKPHGRRRRGKR